MEDRNVGEALLKKEYHENCPGCKVDKAKDLKVDVSFRNLFNIWMLTFLSSLPTQSLFPYLYFMVRDFHIAEREEDISGYAGYVGSAFMVGRALTSILWGIIADRYGRKPVMTISVISVVILNTMFGLSTSLWMAVITRLLLGCLNGLIGTMKAYCSEILGEENQARGISYLSAAYGMGVIIGPALGGYLAQPTIKYPNIFPKDSLWDKFPYLLPCVPISVFGIIVLISLIWLPETLHNHPIGDESINDAEALKSGSKRNDENETIVKKDGNLLLNWPLMSSIIVYCIMSLSDIAYYEVFSLWAVSPRRLGGLNFTTDNVGNVFTIAGLGMTLYQFFLYPILEKPIGSMRFARIAGVLAIPIVQIYPFLSMLSGITQLLVVNILCVLKNILVMTITTGIFLLQNRVVEQHQRGAANGLAMTGMAISNAIGPAGGGAVLAWSQKRMDATFLPGPHMVFFVINIVVGLGVLWMFMPFFKEKMNTPSEKKTPSPPQLH